MSIDTGLPDYVRDHFTYVVKAKKWPRLGQALFFGSSLSLPFVSGAILVTWSEPLHPVSRVAFIITAAVFGLSVVWYLIWMQSRLERFRRERPASYDRWYGLNRRRSFGGSSLAGQLKLAKMQLKYIFFGKEPSPDETLDLTMRFSRGA